MKQEMKKKILKKDLVMDQQMETEEKNQFLKKEMHELTETEVGQELERMGLEREEVVILPKNPQQMTEQEVETIVQNQQPKSSSRSDYDKISNEIAIDRLLVSTTPSIDYELMYGSLENPDEVLELARTQGIFIKFVKLS